MFEFLGSFISSVLVAYLAFTNIVADQVIRIAELEETPPAQSVSIDEEPTRITASEELKNLSKQLTTSLTTEILSLIRTNDAYLQAAQSAAALGEEFTPTPSDTPVRNQIEESLVNIFCQYKTDEYIRTTTGTGFFINKKGVILTNAHVAQFLLLEGNDEDVIDAECIVRTGNPAVPTYHAELLYLSPMWVYENAALIAEETPRGTGERDYALLYVSEPLKDRTLPETFPSLTLDTDLLSIHTKGISILTSGYPAEALFREGARARLVPVIASTTLRELYTFGSNYADIFSVSESPVGAQGASGGPIARESGDVIGLIVTKGNEETEGQYSLHAITVSYINRTIIEETGYSLRDNMQGDLAYRGDVFKGALTPFLAKLLTEELLAGEKTE